MNYRTAAFVKSVTSASQCPQDSGAEVAFVGRSNCGKSSAINALCDQKSLARVGKTPGRTQVINFFSIESMQTRLVDLPGYGYAKVSAAERRRWQKMIEGYFSSRHTLKGVVLLIDSRHPLKEFDTTMIDFANKMGLAVHIVLTKADKLSHNQQVKTRQQVSRTLAREGWDQTCTLQLFAAPVRQGVSELARRVDQWFGQ